MFTGLIEAIGTVAAVAESAGEEGLRRLSFSTPWRGIDVPAIGASVAIDGTCLTVVERDCESGQVAMEVATETRRRTTLGTLGLGRAVHLERALKFGDRLDGHLVSGHVDGIGVVKQLEQRPAALYLTVAAPPAVIALSAPQGAITLAGVSLTLVDVEADALRVALVPHTLQATTLGSLAPGDRINCEADLLARYIARLLERQQAAKAQSAGVGLTP